MAKKKIEGSKVDSVKHKDTRAYIPSKEEAGYEGAAHPPAKSYPLNPVVERGQDPELLWLGKYGEKDEQTNLDVDIRSLYRHEHVAPEVILQRLYKVKRASETQDDMFADELFGNYKTVDELDKPGRYYKHGEKWSNRLIQGDSLLTMASLLEREGMAGRVQTVYIDPPYGIKYGSNWQMKIGERAMPSSDPDDALSAEPEVIKAFRDTWELGIHSYLSYLRERLLLVKELLTESGSCFVQISDENVHLVRCLMDEVFGSGNFVVSIIFKKKSSTVTTEPVNDIILWYARDKGALKVRKLYAKRSSPEADSKFNTLIDQAGEMRRVAQLDEPEIARLIGSGWRWARVNYPLVSQDRNERSKDFVWNGKSFSCGANRHWTYDPDTAMHRLAEIGRIFDGGGKSLGGVVYWDDWPYVTISNLWDDLHGEPNPVYVVQTTYKAIQRCILMTTDPGDLVLDPTCGSGTTAYVAEQWGRRWITIDTSRIALNIAKSRLATATFPWYVLADEKDGKPPREWDVRHGFDYKKLPHVTLKSLANDEPPEEETLFDQPGVDKKKLRVAGPFTVETLQSFEPLAPEELIRAAQDAERVETFTQRIYAHLQSAGVKNGAKNENAVFSRVVPLANEWLHAEGWYASSRGESKAYIHIGPQFGAVARGAVNEAVKEARARGDADWLIILGFAFESDIDTDKASQLAGFQVSKVRMHDDLLQAGLMKKDRKAASFVTIGEPDVALEREGESVTVEIQGLDIYDPIRDEVKPRSVADIAYWMLDDDYDGSNFMVRQVFFCGGDKDEFDKWKKGLSDLAKQKTKRDAERTLKIEIDDEAFDRMYGHRSHPIPFRKGRRVAVRVVSQFGEESTRVLTL
jgi:adenine-specific DNA-methyltransferase